MEELHNNLNCFVPWEMNHDQCGQGKIPHLETTKETLCPLAKSGQARRVTHPMLETN